MTGQIPRSKLGKEIRSLLRRYEDLQAGGFAVKTSCNCMNSLVEILVQLLNQLPAGFDTLLGVSEKAAKQCRTIMACAHCHKYWPAIFVLQSTLKIMLAIYEGASAAYSLGGTHGSDQASYEVVDTGFPEAKHTGGYRSAPERSIWQPEMPPLDAEMSPLRQTVRDPYVDESHICEKSEASWGGVELMGEDARLLARILLRERLITLSSLMQQLRGVLFEMRFGTQAPSQEALGNWHESLSLCMDRLTILLGRLR